MRKIFLLFSLLNINHWFIWSIIKNVHLEPHHISYTDRETPKIYYWDFSKIPEEAKVKNYPLERRGY